MTNDLAQQKRNNVKCYALKTLVHCNDYYMGIGISITRNTLSWNVINITIHQFSDHLGIEF